MKFILPGLLAALFASSVFARDFENGDFAKDKTGWLGDGRVVYLKEDGTVSATKEPGTTPVVEIALNKTQPRDFTQKFTTEEGTGALEVEVVYKGSADFKLNEKSTKFTKDNTWQAGATMYWSALVVPKVDLCLRLDQPTGFAYRLAKVSPGSDWQTLKVRWDSIGAKKDVKLCVIAPPGEGSLFVKSVAVKK
jgi:hypothetical protein